MKLDFIQIGANIGNEEDFIGKKILSGEIQNGIFIEPNPKSFKILKNKFENNNNFFLEQLAIDIYVGKTTLYVEKFEDEFHVSHIASTVKDFTKNHPWGKPFSITGIEVNCDTLENIWKKYNLEHVKYLCVDTEGNDFNILINCDFSKLNISEIQFEHMHTDGVHQTGKNYEKLKTHLINFGYNNIIIAGGDTIARK